MNKTLNINLAGFVMHIDEDAFERLQSYLDKVKSYLGNTEVAEEIIRDVEARLVEIFQERMSEERQVVQLHDVDAAIEILGQPEDYKMDDQEQESTASDTEPNFRPKKRIFRNPDDKIIGGVAGGLSAYLGIDPIWLRLLLAIMFFTGSGFLIYIILWIVMPEAKTTAQKLQMRGEPVNLSSIEKSLRDELKKAGSSMERAANNMKDAKIADKLNNFLRETIDLIVNLFTLIFKAIFKILGVALVLFGVFLIFTLTAALFWGSIHVNGDTYTYTEGLSLLQEFIDNPAVYYFAVAGVLMTTIVPALYIIAIIIRHLFKLPKLNPLVRQSSVGLIIIGVFFLLFSGIRFARDFHADDSVEEVVMLQYQGTTHSMKIMDLPDGEPVEIDINGNLRKWIIGEDISHFGLVEFDVESTNSDAAFVELRTNARGRSNKDARFHAKNIDYQISEEDSTLLLPAYYSISQGQTFRFQTITATLKLPVGHTVYLDEGLDGIMNYVNNVNNMYSYEMPGHYWEMTEKGLKCLDCIEETYENSSDTSKSTTDEWEELKGIPEHQ